MNTMGSQALTPKRKLAMRRVSPLHALPNHQLADGGAICAERHADAHLLGALLHRVGHKPVDADGGKHQRYSAKNAEQHHVEAVASGGADDDFVHETNARNGKSSAGLA
jgi:hypothetical protein